MADEQTDDLTVHGTKRKRRKCEHSIRRTNRMTKRQLLEHIRPQLIHTHGGCLLWPTCDDGKPPRIYWNGARSIARLLKEETETKPHSHSTLRSTCGEIACVNPEHRYWSDGKYSGREVRKRRHVKRPPGRVIPAAPNTAAWDDTTAARPIRLYTRDSQTPGAASGFSPMREPKNDAASLALALVVAAGVFMTVFGLTATRAPEPAPADAPPIAIEICPAPAWTSFGPRSGR